MKSLLKKLQFWRSRAPTQESEINVCLELHSKDNASGENQRVFKLTHIQAQHLDTPDKVIAEWLSLPDTVLYFKRTSHQSIHHPN